MEIKQISVGSITPYGKNAKKHDKKQIHNIAESIKQYGWTQPLVLDKDNVIVIGHGRFFAAKELKLKEVPCVYVDSLTDEQVKALRIADNKLNETPWDFELLR
ncbi:MAG: ParB N-terminal domain-containing protein, partial [Lachnospiraceae bacterium]|nr:ParB N-terminal domain-containing protein [Lachnospiraceae bacterium]